MMPSKNIKSEPVAKVPSKPVWRINNLTVGDDFSMAGVRYRLIGLAGAEATVYVLKKDIIKVTQTKTKEIEYGVAIEKINANLEID